MSTDSIDYISAHLSWIRRNPSFSPIDACCYKDGRTHYQVMSDFYAVNPATGVPVPQCVAKGYFKADRQWYEQSVCINNLITKEIIAETKLKPFEWFVTIGFNHQTWTVAKCVNTISKLMDFDWVISCKSNFELFRENGEHPHCHFLIKTFEHKSKVLEKFFRPKYVQDIVLKKSFIDIKKAELYHYDYINLVKTDAKMQCVNQDIVWRQQNKIPNFEKNWETI
jgi:hypothetical protein